MKNRKRDINSYLRVSISNPSSAVQSGPSIDHTYINRVCDERSCILALLIRFHRMSLVSILPSNLVVTALALGTWESK